MRSSCKRTLKGATVSIIETIVKILKKFLDILHELTSVAGGLIVFAMGFLMLLVVVLRYFFDYNLLWGFTILSWMLVWGTFIMVGSVTRRRQHIAIGMVARLLFRRRELTVRHTLENIIGLGFCIFMAWHSWEWVANLRDLGYVRYVGTNTYKEWKPAAIMPAGFIIAVVYYFERCIGQLRDLYIFLNRNRSTPLSTIENRDER